MGVLLSREIVHFTLPLLLWTPTSFNPVTMFNPTKTSPVLKVEETTEIWAWGQIGGDKFQSRHDFQSHGNVPCPRS